MIRRIIQAIPILFGISILIFGIVQLAPGSPVDRFRVPRVPPEQIEALIRLYGLDKPVLEQYVTWITAFVQVWRVDAWGYSFIDGRPVLANIMERLPATLLLMGAALIVTIIFSVPIGILAAVKQYSWTDKIITHASRPSATPSRRSCSASTSGTSAAIVLRDLTGGVRRRVRLPAVRPAEPGLGRRHPIDLAFHLVLPVTALAIQSIAGVLALPARVDARRHAPGLRPDGQGQGRRRARGSSDATPCATRSSRSSR